MHYNPTEALERIDNDTSLLIMLIDVFIKECPSYIGKLQAACDRQDLNALGDAAHNVKGASAAIGFDECNHLAEELEVTCRQSGVKSIAHFENSTAKLIAVLNACEAPLKDWVKKTAPKRGEKRTPIRFLNFRDLILDQQLGTETEAQATPMAPVDFNGQRQIVQHLTCIAPIGLQ